MPVTSLITVNLHLESIGGMNDIFQQMAFGQRVHTVEFMVHVMQWANVSAISGRLWHRTSSQWQRLLCFQKVAFGTNVTIAIGKMGKGMKGMIGLVIDESHNNDKD